MGPELVRLVRLTPFAREEFELTYQETADPLERARRFVVRSFFGFGSAACTEPYRTGFRANSARRGVTPARDWETYPDALNRIIDRMRGVTIENRDAVEVLAKADSPDTLHYIDPPYLHSTRKKWQGRNYRHEMTDGDHRDLARVVRSLRGGAVISGYASALYDEELYPDWHRVTKQVLADGARPRTEVLWINKAAWSTQGRLL